MQKINRRGHEIGLHPSYCTYRNLDSLKLELSHLKSVVNKIGIKSDIIGSRMHYLRFIYPDTLRILDVSGISYDTTLGYADCPGFRCGTCFNYRPFDPIVGKSLSIKIIPLVVMDDTIISDKYLGLGTSLSALEIITNLKNTCKLFGGTFTLLWHNCNLDTPEKRNFYEKILSN